MFQLDKAVASSALFQPNHDDVPIIQAPHRLQELSNLAGVALKVASNLGSRDIPSVPTGCHRNLVTNMNWG